MYKRVVLNGLVILGLTAGVNVSAADQEPGFYAGVGVGEASLDIDVGFDGSDTAFEVFGGYSFNQYLAVEMSYLDGGKPDQRFGNASAEFEVTGVTASVVGTLPLNEMFSLYAKLGMASYEVEGTARLGNQILLSEKGTDDDLFYGVGAAQNIGSFGLRAEYKTVDISDGGFDIVSLNGLFRF